jgi:hypothetical protein
MYPFFQLLDARVASVDNQHASNAASRGLGHASRTVEPTIDHGTIHDQLPANKPA